MHIPSSLPLASPSSLPLALPTPLPRFQHHSQVTDLIWMPGIECNRGKFSKLGEGSKECNFFATSAGDGKVTNLVLLGTFWGCRPDPCFPSLSRVCCSPLLVCSPLDPPPQGLRLNCSPSPIPPPCTPRTTQVNFWDIRVDRLVKKGRKSESDMSDLVWRPTHSVGLVSLLG